MFVTIRYIDDFALIEIQKYLNTTLVSIMYSIARKQPMKQALCLFHKLINNSRSKPKYSTKKIQRRP